MEPDLDQLQQVGERVRVDVLGAAHVAATTAADSPTQAAQDVITALIWGGVWGRAGLAPRERSLVSLAVVTALSQPGPIELHIRGALHHGLTPDEIAEAIVQAGAYAGFSAASVALGVARRVFDEPTADTPERE